MSLEDHSDLIAQINRLTEIASLDYQSFQLAAQRADIEGQPLAAGVLRSISESQAGKAHALLTFVRTQGADASQENGIKGLVEAAARRVDEVEQLSAALLAQADAVLQPRQLQDLQAAMTLTANNRPRLERLLAALAAE